MRTNRKGKAHFFCFLLTSIFISTICFMGCDKEQQAIFYDVDFYVGNKLIATNKTDGYNGIDFPEVDIQSGYEFLGWFVDKDVWQNEMKASDFFEGNIKEKLVLYARIEEKIVRHTVTFSYNYTDQEFSVVEGKTVEPLDVNFKGYELVGWINTKTNTYFDFSQAITEPLLLKAEFVRLTYNIAYITDGGIWDGNETKYQYGDNFEFLPCKKNGYEFLGWFNKAEGGEQLENTFNLDGDLTLYAYFSEPINYSIKYNLADGINSEENSIDYNIESINIVLHDATKKGYNFLGWFDGDENRITQIPSGSTGNIILAAKWEKTVYNINYNLDSNEQNSPDNLNSYTITDNITFLDAEKNGYEFLGWFNKAEGGERVYSIMLGSTGSINIYPKWELSVYILNYRLQPDEINSQNNPATFTINDTIILEPATKIGYMFIGWFNSYNEDNQITEIPKGSTGDLTLYPRFKPNTYIVILDNADATSGTSGEITVTFHKYITDGNNLTKPLKSGYIFMGYYDSVSGGNKYLQRNMLGAKAWDIAENNMTLYARFIEGTDVLDYEKTEGGLLVSGISSIYEPSVLDIVIPLEYDDTPVIGIKDKAFYQKTKIKTMTIPSSVATVGFSAFQESSVSKVTFRPNSNVDTFEEYAFYECKFLTEIVLPDKLTTIGFNCFAESALSKIDLPASFSRINNNAFYNCKSLSLVSFVGKSLSYIGSYAFYSCENLESIIIVKNVVIGSSAFEFDSSLTIYTEETSFGSDWSQNMFDATKRPIVYGTVINSDNGIIKSVTINSSTFANVKESTSLSVPYCFGYRFSGWYTEPNGGGTSQNLLDFAIGTTAYAHYAAK